MNFNLSQPASKTIWIRNFGLKIDIIKTWGRSIRYIHDNVLLIRDILSDCVGVDATQWCVGHCFRCRQPRWVGEEGRLNCMAAAIAVFSLGHDRRPLVLNTAYKYALYCTYTEVYVRLVDDANRILTHNAQRDTAAFPFRAYQCRRETWSQSSQVVIVDDKNRKHACDTSYVYVL